MKIVVPSSGTSLESPLNLAFGKSPYFLVVDVNDSDIKLLKVIENQNIGASRGAGISSAQLVANEKPQVVIVGNIGPNAISLLKHLGIKIFLCNQPITVKEAINLYIQGKLTEL